MLKFIYNFIKDLLYNFENNFDKQILVVLDNFDDDCEEEITILKDLFTLIKEEDNRNKIKLIISGRCPFLYKKEFDYLKDELNIRIPSKLEILLYYIFILKNFYKNRITFGIFEEKFLILLLSYNKLDLENLQIREENRLEVYEIYQFKQSIYEQTDKAFKKNESIIINQEYYLGQNYDLLILYLYLLLIAIRLFLYKLEQINQLTK